METSYLTTMSTKGQLTVPKEIRERLHLIEGQKLILEPSGDSLIIKKAKIVDSSDSLHLEESEWEELRKMASTKGKVYKSGKAFLKSLKSR